MTTLTSSFLLEYSLIPDVLLAANDEERMVGQRTWGPNGQGLEHAWFLSSYFIKAYTLVLLCPS